MSNKLTDIFSSMEQSTPGIEWASFYLSGYGDEFAGFRELETCIDGEVARHGAAEDNEQIFPCGTDLENIVNSPENQPIILDAIVPAGHALKCVGQGSCSGLLLIVIKKRSDADCITVPGDELLKGLYARVSQWSFDVPAGFRGLMIRYENLEDSRKAESAIA